MSSKANPDVWLVPIVERVKTDGSSNDDQEIDLAPFQHKEDLEEG